MTAIGPGRVYDRGYRPYEGELGGRRAARGALFRASVRRALGIRRSWRQKLFPWVLLAIVTVPAIVNVGIAYVTRDQFEDTISIITYREYVGVSTALLVFVGLTAPDVICPDRRHRMLPLLFARPLTGTDYVIAKVGAIAAVVFAFGFLPQVVLFVGQMLVSDAAIEYLTDNAAVLWQVPLAVAALALYYSSLAVAISSFATRRIVAAAALLILLLVSSVTAGVLTETQSTGSQRFGGETEFDSGDRFGGETQFDGSERFGGRERFGDETEFDGDEAWFAGGQAGTPWAAVNLLNNPLQIRDIIFEGEIQPGSDLAYVARGEGLAVGVYLAVVVLSLGTLLWRYRWVEA